jgi:uncharacterized protein (DUF2141 family)
MRFKLLFLCACLPAFAGNGSEGRLTVHVSGARNSKGLIRVALWNHSSGFPIDAKRVVTGGSAEIGPNGDAVVTLDHIAPGTYALSSYHDENANGKLDTNLVGIPKEEYGFSNHARAKVGPPSFDAARFLFDGKNQTVELTIETFRFTN